MIDLEEDFADCVERMGGEVLDRSLSKPPDFANADYLFRDDGVVAELKRIEKTILNESFRKAAGALYQKWFQQGKAPLAIGTVRIDLGSLPEECALEYFGLIRKKIQPVIVKANRQIRETRERFGLPDALGLLLLAVDGDTGLTPEGLLHVVGRSFLGAGFTSINNVIIFSASCYIEDPETGRRDLPWFEARVGDDRLVIAPSFLRSLSNAWMQEVALKTGDPVLVVQHEPNPDQPLLRGRIRPLEQDEQG